MTRRTKILIGVGVVGLATVGWLVVKRGVNLWMWDAIALRPLSPAEESALATCGERPDWWAMVKALSTDRPAGDCGEAWFVRQLADHVGSGDKAAWLFEHVGDPESAVGLRFRGAVALAVAGRSTPTEAAWLRPQLDDARRVASRELGLDPALAVHLGPGGMALGLADRAAAGELEAVDALPALLWLARVGEGDAKDAVAAAVALLADDPGVDDRTFDPQAPRRKRSADPLEALAADLAREGPDRVPADPVADAIVRGLGGTDADLLAEEWLRGALVAWLAPDPEARLRSLWTRPTPGPIARFGWDGAGPPFAAAAVLSRVRPELAFRADRPGVVWLDADGWVARGCAEAGLEPPAEDWPARAVVSRAWLEAGDARAAARLDPSVAAPAPVGDPVAYALGASLVAPAPLDGADTDRARLATADLPWCR